MDVKVAGKKGGTATSKKLGVDHYRRIGRIGGKNLWKKIKYAQKNKSDSPSGEVPTGDQK